MAYFNEPWRALAAAAKMRDWDTVDAVIEDQRIKGNVSIIRGVLDAKRKLGEDPPLPRLATPDPVTIHDLPNHDGIEIFGAFGDTHRWRRKGEPSNENPPAKRRKRRVA